MQDSGQDNQREHSGKPLEVSNSKARAAVNAALRKIRLGDKIAAVTKAAGIRECGGCARRRARLNGE